MTVDRILVDPSGALVGDKSKVLTELARLLSAGSSADPTVIEHQLTEREKLQSTGIGDGVAIPHTSVEEFSAQKAALILAPRGVEFESIDGHAATIIFGVVGPKRAASEHLKILAKVSRLLRSPETPASIAGSCRARAGLHSHRGARSLLGDSMRSTTPPTSAALLAVSVRQLLADRALGWSGVSSLVLTGSIVPSRTPAFRRPG